MSHTLLQLIDEQTGQQITDPQKRMAIFVSNLRSALPHAFDWLPKTNLQVPISLQEEASTGGRGVSTFPRDLVLHSDQHDNETLYFLF